MKINTEHQLQKHTSFQVPCIADECITIENEQDLLDALSQKKNKRIYILGGGSNTLFTNSSFAGTVLKNEIYGKEIIKTNKDHDLILVGGGENRDQFVKRTIQEGYYGLENLISIPGTVGAAPIQNIGAYGVEVRSHVHEVHTIKTDTQKKNIFSSKDCEFGYRDSLFKRHDQQYFITGVVFKLSKYSPDTYTPLLDYRGIEEKLQEHGIDLQNITPENMANAIAEIRSEKLPNWKELGTAGSFFKNPVISSDQFTELCHATPDLIGREVEKGMIKLSAGQLIDKAGFKGIQKGNVGVYEKHALVLVNYGGGTGEQVVALANEITEKVEKMFHVKLEPEVRWIN